MSRFIKVKDRYINFDHVVSFKVTKYAPHTCKIWMVFSGNRNDWEAIVLTSEIRDIANELIDKGCLKGGVYYSDA